MVRAGAQRAPPLLAAAALLLFCISISGCSAQESSTSEDATVSAETTAVTQQRALQILAAQKVHHWCITILDVLNGRIPRFLHAMRRTSC